MLPSFDEYLKTLSAEKLGHYNVEASNAAISTWPNFQGLLPESSIEQAQMITLCFLLLGDYHEWLRSHLEQS